jgi:hypothetical protein
MRGWRVESGKLKDLKKALMKSGYSSKTVEEIVKWYS